MVAKFISACQWALIQATQKRLFTKDRSRCTQPACADVLIFRSDRPLWSEAGAAVLQFMPILLLDAERERVSALRNLNWLLD
jgi:hypothetical protein